MNPVLHYRRSDVFWMGALALAYALLSKGILGFFSAYGVISILWPPSGLALGALLVGGKKYWPGVFVGVLVGNLITNSPVMTAMPMVFGNTLEAVAGAWLLTRYSPFNPNLVRPSDFVSLGVAGALCSWVGSVIGTSTLVLAGIVARQEFAHTLLLWWQGDTLGILLFTPLILVWRQLPYDWLRPGRMVEVVTCFGLSFLAGQIIFLGWFHDIFGITARGYWMTIFVVWSAVRFGRHGVLLILCMIGVQMLMGAELNTEGFSHNLVPSGAINFWFYMLVLTGTGILLALIIERRKSAEALLQRNHDLLDKLSQHVPGVIYQFRLYPDGRSRFPFASEAIQNIYEVTPDQVREDASPVFAVLHPEDYDNIVASIHESARTLTLWREEFRVVLPKQGLRWRLGESHPEKLEDGSVLWHGFIADITEFKEADEKIQRLTHLYQALSEINQAIIRMERQSELFPLVCRCAVDFGGMTLAWIGRLNEANGLIEPAARYGKGQDYIDSIMISSQADVPEGCGPTGTALREGRSVVLNDYLASPMTLPWQAEAAKYDWRSAAAFPIRRGGRPFAVLSVYNAHINAFDSAAISLLEEMSKDVSFALDNFDHERQRALAEESLLLAASVYETSSEAMAVSDADGIVLTVNPAFTKVTGYMPEEVVGKSFSLFNSDHHDQSFYQAMWKEITTTGHWQGEIWDKRKNGDPFAIWLTVNSILNKDGSVNRRVSLFSDITERKKSEELIWQQANYDPLTNLPNRRMFHDRLEQEIRKAHRAELPLALMFLDLDHFKEVNDTLGHDMGDILLKEAAQRLSRCVRETDTVARLGGDEFTVILGELDDLGSVERVAQDILHKLVEPFHLGEEVAYVSVSIGITLYPEDATEIDVLVKNADQAMYAAKQQGRNRYNYFTGTMQQEAQSRRRLTNDLRDALANKQFWVAYQPIVELATNNIHKAEALIRWQHPTRGLVGPAEFIPIAEDTGMIIDIGEWVFREAAEQVKHWTASYHPGFQISVNKSPVQFNAENLAYAQWATQLQQLGLSGKNILVEITEGLLLDASANITDKLLGFRDAGIQVSLDDFGTGYSSLSYLKKFDIDYLKIDQSFTRNLAPGSDDMALCEAIIVMAHKLGIRVIAEGVETEAQKNLLIMAGCDYGQGYLFSRPVAAADFERLLERQPGIG